MKIFSLVSLKGGVGKTTSAMHLAACATRNAPVVVIDADPERSALSWSMKVKLPFKVAEGSINGLAGQAKGYARDHIVFIDTPPNNREVLNKAAFIADTVVVPLKPSGLDLDRLNVTLEILEDVEVSRGELDVAILLTHAKKGTILTREVQSILRGKDFPILGATIRNLEDYADAFPGEPRYLLEYEGVWEELNE